MCVIVTDVATFAWLDKHLFVYIMFLIISFIVWPVIVFINRCKNEEMLSILSIWEVLLSLFDSVAVCS